MSVTRVARPSVWVCKACRASPRGTLLLPLQARWQSTIPETTKAPKRQWSTPLARTIGEAIQLTGPISIAQYMRQCLTSPDGGYYTRQAEEGDQFGQKGDFITSPEISQVFGELIGLWFLTEWMAQGRIKSGVELIEVGPGRGTLMDDMLRTVRNFKAFAGSIESVYMVEASPSLRNKQKELLCGDAPMQETEIGWRSTAKYGDIPVTWCEDIRFVPHAADKTPFIIAHEFFDALPIHAFRAVPPSPERQNTVIGLDGKPIEMKTTPSPASKVHQWRELMVSIAPPPKEHTAAHNPYSNVSSATPPDFELTQAKASTPSSLLVPEISARYRALKSHSDSVIEVSPESHSYAGEFARRIGGGNVGKTVSSSPSTAIPKPKPSGAALILDYGTMDTVPTSTLRGIRAHELVNPFTTPGLTDLSADVDFTALADAALDASPGVEVHGPVEQGMFLETMGIRERAAVLEKQARQSNRNNATTTTNTTTTNNGSTTQSTDPADANANAEGEGEGEVAAARITAAVNRLVERGGGGMGKIYKALAILPENGGRRRPVGFGGQVVQ